MRNRVHSKCVRSSELRSPIRWCSDPPSATSRRTRNLRGPHEEDDALQADAGIPRARVHLRGPQRPLRQDRRRSRLQGHLGLGPLDLRGDGRARQQRGLVDPGPRGARVHGRADLGADPARRRHRLRQLQQHAPPGAEARAARRRGGLHRGQDLPQDQLLHQGRGPAAGRCRRVRGQDQGRQGRRQRPRLLHRRAHRGVHRRLGHGRGAQALRGLPRRGRRRRARAQQARRRRRDHRLHEGVGQPPPRRDRADQVLRHADRRRSARPESRS